jgi:probable HAF family extracellular repeat protein
LRAGRLLLNRPKRAYAHPFIYEHGSFVTIDLPGGVLAAPDSISINNRGQVAGSFENSSSQSHGFVYEHGVITTIDVPGANSTYVVDLNNQGDIAGFYLDDTGKHGFVYDGETFTSIDVPWGVSGSTAVADINNHGQIVGSFGSYNDSTSYGFVYDDGTFTAIAVPDALYGFADVINDRGEIAGVYYDADGGHAYVASPVPQDQTTIFPFLKAAPDDLLL